MTTIKPSVAILAVSLSRGLAEAVLAIGAGVLHVLYRLLCYFTVFVLLICLPH
jgi:hypothetical protein